MKDLVRYLKQITNNHENIFKKPLSAYFWINLLYYGVYASFKLIYLITLLF